MRKILLFLLVCFSVSSYGQNVGIGTTSPQTKLHVDGGTVMFSGDTGSMVTPPNARGFVWSPGKQAIRYGYQYVEDGDFAWHDSTTGNFSFSAGSLAIARGAHSFAMGDMVRANAEGSFVVGNTSAATGRFSSTRGLYSGSSGAYSTSIGESSTAIGRYSLSLGTSTSAEANHSVAIGENLISAASHSLVLGRNNFVSGTPGSWLLQEPVLVIGNGGGQGSGYSSQNNAFTIYKNGNLQSVGNVYHVADQSVMEYTYPISNALAKVTSLNGINFYWRYRDVFPSSIQSGILATNVQAQMPELVSENEKNEKTVNYAGMIPYLVEAIKELKAENEALKAIVTALTNE